MTIYDLPATSNWKKLMRDYNLLNLFCKMLVPGKLNDFCNDNDDDDDDKGDDDDNDD